MDTIDALNRIGQHLWLDDISMTALDEGDIARYRDECSVSGVTANPTIFERAISSHAYDHKISASGDSPDKVFWQLAIDDVQRAADLFADIHRRSGERTGWVSIELEPGLAGDADGSVAQATELRDRIDRPNVMVKVPGTREGVRAVEQLTYLGVPVNVTLLFGLEQWRAVADAYCSGLERRLADGRSLAVPSVASFFLSRIDRKFDEMVPDDLQHQTAIACAAHVYEQWRAMLDSPRWVRLADEGAASQQLLWASTSPKAEDLDETYYAKRLAAPDTVITLPSHTLDALCAAEGDELTPLEGLDVDHVDRTLERIEQESGTTLAEAADDLQTDGVTSFSDSFDSLIATIEQVRTALAST